MGTAESERFELVVGVADEVAVRKEQQFDDIPAQIAIPGGRGTRLGSPRIGVRCGIREIYVRHVDIS